MRFAVPDFKLRPPVQAPHPTPRPRLMRWLHAATEPVVVVSAPAGAGKTELLTAWWRDLAARSECAWLSLDARDNNPGRLWAGVLAAVRGVRPDLDVEPGTEDWAIDLWADDLLPQLLTGLYGGSPLTLILDGLECITDSDALRSLEHFLTRLPSAIRIVVSTRHVPGAPFPALRARGLVAELDQHDLCFTRDEARELLTDLLGSTPTSDALNDLHAATEGWAAGLCIMGRTLARSDGTTPTAEHLARCSRAVADYLSSEVLDRLTTKQRHFLLRTSVLDELSTGPCRALVGRDDAGVLLRELARTEQLLIPVVAESPTYRPHPALRSLLSDVLAAEQPEAAVSLHRAAAQWHGGRKQTASAVRHFVLAGDHASAGATILADWEETIAAGRTADVSAWLGLLPDRSVAADARLCVVAAMAALSNGAPDVGGRWLDVAQARELDGARAGELDGAQAGETVPGTVGEGSTVAEAAAVAKAVACCLTGEILSADQLGGLAVSGTLPLTPWRALACMARGAALLWLGRYEEAEALLAVATRDAHAAGHCLVLVRALGTRALCALLAGQHEQARFRADEALRSADANGLGRHFVSAAAHLCQAGVMLEDTALDEAQAALADAETALASTRHTPNEPHLRTLSLHLRSSLENARHHADAAREAADAAARAAAHCATPGLLTDLLRRAVPCPADATATSAPLRPQDLSPGEARVLRALCGPLTLREIAAELYVSHNTVKTQVRAIFRKLDAHNRTGAVARARECGVL